MKQETKKSEKPPFRYRSQFGVLVICEDEKKQQEVYDRLLADGYKFKVVCV